MGAEELPRSNETWDHRGDADSGEDGHQMVPQLHHASVGDTIPSGTVAVQRNKESCTISEYDSSLPSRNDVKGEKMIQIYDNWYIQVGPNSYDVIRVMPSKTKDGEDSTRTDNYGYYGSLQSALEGLAKELQRVELSDKDLTLAQAIVSVIESNARLKNAIREALPEMKVVRK